MSDQTRVRDLLEERAAAMRAGNADRLVADYLPDAVTFTLAPPLKHTAPEVHDAEALRAWFATFASAVDYEIRDLEITVNGRLAFCHSLNRMSAVPQGLTEPFDLWFRSTVCLRQVDGAWRIAHEHTSTPFYMDGTFSAALDLKP
ncbi:YybH family protein [Saccharothrix deserti]|uniref:YybH family protein n=1 Tax=Saccharothrix deserti TaxID=2593674 RepID=UPI00131AA242|nr:nuclear transport factor 2 family protein [Saccharothrix deserti]